MSFESANYFFFFFGDVALLSCTWKHEGHFVTLVLVLTKVL